MNNNKSLKITAEICRILIGAVFIFSGFVKSVDPTGSAIKIGEYLESFGAPHPSWLSMFLSFNLSSIEFALGVCVLLAVLRWWSSLLTLVFMCVMTPLTLYLALYNPVADCGCFGDALVITNWQTFYKNIVLLAAAVIVFIYRNKLEQIYSRALQGFIALFAFFFCIGFCYWNFAHLPVIDFRPYKVGENIPSLMNIPPDAPQDEYVFIYEKEGVTKEFTLDNSPAGDSAWTYVDARLVSKGFVPKIGSFELFDENNINLAEEILQQPELVMLFVSPHLDEASEKSASKINNLYDFAQETDGLQFYFATASSDEEIASWRKDTGSDYQMLTADDVVLKTMIRSNPGLLVLREGTILNKYHFNDFPSPDDILALAADYQSYIDEAVLDAKWKPATSPQKANFWLFISAAFFVPLLLIWLYDFLIVRKSKRV